MYICKNVYLFYPFQFLNERFSIRFLDFLLTRFLNWIVIIIKNEKKIEYWIID